MDFALTEEQRGTQALARARGFFSKEDHHGG
jgi:hypothetical protein